MVEAKKMMVGRTWNAKMKPRLPSVPGPLARFPNTNAAPSEAKLKNLTNSAAECTEEPPAGVGLQNDEGEQELHHDADADELPVDTRGGSMRRATASTVMKRTPSTPRRIGTNSMSWPHEIVNKGKPGHAAGRRRVYGRMNGKMYTEKSSETSGAGAMTDRILPHPLADPAPAGDR